MMEFEVPAGVELVDPMTGKPIGEKISFAQYAFKHWGNDQRMIATNGNMDNAKVARLGAILPKFQTAAGEKFRLEDADAESVLAIVRAPLMQNAYAPFAEAQCVQFPRAMLDGKKVVEEKVST